MRPEYVHEMFARAVERYAERPALLGAEGNTTYGDLDRRSSRLAEALRDSGAERGAIVAILADETLDTAAAILACLKAGCAFMPLAPETPAPRLAAMFAAVPPDRFIVGAPHVERVLAASAERGAAEPRMLATALAADSGLDAAPLPPVSWAPDDLAYVFFTSGSTGSPKGIAGRLKAIDHFVRWEIEALGVEAGFRVSQLVSPGFDAVLRDLFVPLCAGGAVCVPPDRSTVLDAGRLTDWIDAAGVELIHCVPSLFRAMLNEPLESEMFAALRYVLLAGEHLLPADVGRWMDVFGDRVKLVNLYGPSETTMTKFVYFVQPGDRARASIPIGKPMPGAAAAIVDARGKGCPPGTVGEIYIRTPYRSLGYLNQPELTRQAFIPNPFNDDPNDIVYRTGDLGRALDDGSFELLGRRDGQVKIRGVRIELGEVESALREHRAVKDVAVIDREDRPGFKMLCAYVVAGEGGDPEALREFVARRLPETMVPSAFVTMEKLPKTLTGKVDRKALPPPTAGQDRQREYVAPRNQTEELLGGIWTGLLGLETVGVTDNFFELGGHSLLATRLLSRVRESFKVELPLQTLFSAPTLERLALRVESAMRSGAGVDGPPLLPAPRNRRLRLSFAQQRLWFLDQLEPGDTTYNLPVVLRLAGRLEVGVLRRALAEIVRRHESLRTTFDAGEDEPVQRIHPPSDSTRLPVLDLGGLVATAGEREAERLARAEARRPFDLLRGPLLRVHLLRLGGRLHHALATLHHIVSDAWSTGVLTREVGLLYRAYAESRPSPLPELAIQYADFADWQRDRLAGEFLAKEIAYWRDALAGAPPVLELPTDRPRPAMRSSRGSARAAVLSRELSSSLAKLGRGRGATRFMTLLAGFQALVARLARVDDVSVGTPIAGRNRIETEGLIGFFVNTLVLRAQLGDEPTFLALLDRVRRSAMAAQSHQELPFEKLVEELAPERSLSHSPLFQIMFVLQNAPRAELELPGLTLDALAQEGGAAKFDLTLTLVEGDEELHATAEYATDLFDGASIVRLLEHYRTLLGGVAAGPDRAVSDLPLLSSGELGQLLREWNDSGTATTERSLHELVEAQAERTPEAIAVLADSGWLTYRDLEVAATRLARHLGALGVARETRVGIFAERSLEMVVGLLAVLKAGGAYVPLDPDYPRERLAFMLDDARVPVLLTQQRLAAALPEHDAQVVCLDRDEAWAESSGDDERKPVARVHPDHAAYMIYTSGSTGRPKGAINTHRAIVNRLLWMQDAYRLDATDRVLQKTPFSFDVSVWEFFLPLLSGARLVIARPGGHQDPAYLRRTIVERGITTVHFVPSMLHAFLAEDDVDRCVSLVRVIASGEALPWDLEQRFLSLLPAVELHNLYGPTEASVDVTAWACGADEGTRSIVPIGRPIANAQIYLFDRRLRPVPLGVTGELYIGGMPLARGYLGRAALTAEKFVPDPFGVCPGARLYRTGDLARHRQNGAIEYLGRTDHQVKLRGFRIELGEIESALADHPSVGEAAVVLREDEPGDRRVVAYVVGRDGGTPSTVELGGYLRGRLPEYMAPSAIVALDRLPLTPNGKLDRRALPAPSRQLEAATFEAPRTEIETILAAIWSEVLRVEEIGAHDDFFALGGHSLLATQVMSRIRRILRLELPLRALFSAPTLSGLAAAVERELRSAGALEAPPILPVPRDGALPLSFAQQRLWFLDRLEPGNPAYNSFVAFRISGGLRPEILERSLGALVERHESLRSTFEEADGIPAQRVMPPPAPSLPRVALVALLPAAMETEVIRLAGSFAIRPFDLGRGPLLRACLVGTGEAEHVAFLCLHHIVADGWSLGILMREVTALYQVFAAGGPSVLPPLPVQYPDYADWQRRWLRGEVLEGFLAYWRDQLAGAPPLLALPLDRPRPAVQTYAGAAQAFALSPELSRALRDFGRRAGATPFMTMLAGFEVLVQRYSGQSDLSIGTAIANRNRFETEGLIGFLVNTLVLRTHLADDPTCSALLERVRDVALDAYAHQDMPFEKLVEELQPQRNLAHAPLFQIGFDFQNWSLETFALAGLELRRMRFDSVASKFDLTVTTNEAGGSLLGGIEYNTDLFDAPTIARLLGHFERLLAGMVASPGRRISELALLGEGERHQLLVAWNDTVADLPGGDGCLHDLAAAQAAKSPDTVAVVFEDECLTFGDLVRRADRLAGRLRDLGVGPEVRVGLAAERSLSMLVGLLGILGAGGAYVPLDPDQPRERLARVLEDSGAAMVVSPDHLADRWPASIPRVSADSEVLAGAEAPPAGTSGDHLAYVIYTSGSTGRPKGVMVRHSAIVNRLLWMQEEFPLGGRDVVLQKTPLTFDASIWEVFLPLFTGARLELVRPGGHRDSGYLVGRVQERDVTVLQLVPSQLRVFLDEPKMAECRSLRRLFCGGEALAKSLVMRCTELLGASVCNLYGPTESSIDASFARCFEGDRGPSGVVPIGRPLRNVRLYAVSAYGESAPRGASGELWIGGAGLARGYTGSPDATAERFVPDGLSGLSGERLYRTGDRVRFLGDGRIEYQGRLDQQVKVRGVRIEPAEIETALRRHPQVREAVVLVREGPQGESALVAYVEPRGRDAQPDERSFRQGEGIELWPCVGEYQIYDELLYYAMIKDRRRNELYRRAIDRLVAGKVVLDIGTGREAIWARYCAEAGASKVYAIEILEEACESARALVRRLGLEDRIVVVQGDSTAVELPEKVDVCVSNLIGTIGGSEGAAQLLNDARRLVREDGVFIPLRCQTLIAAVTLPDELRRAPSFPPVAAHYVEKVFASVGNPFDVRLCIRNLPSESVLSTAEVFEDLDFSASVAANFDRDLTLRIERAGTLDGFVLWLNLHTIEGEVIDTLHHEHSWLPVYLPAFQPALAVEVGDAIEIHCSARLCDDGLHPDYRVSGRLERRLGPGSEFSFESPHHGPDFRGSAFYASLFLDGSPSIAGREAPTDRELRDHLKAFLPDHLVPSRFVVLDALPMTPSGKLDRQALPALESLGTEAKTARVSARSLLEEVLLGLWRDVLEAEAVGVHDDFFALGGHSLLATRIVSRVRSVLQADLEVRDLFEAPTVARLAERIEAAGAATLGAAPPLRSLGERNPDVRLALSFAQERMWFLQQLEPESSAYNIPSALRLTGPLDVPALAGALGEIVRRHEALRTTFPSREGEPWQEIAPPAPPVSLAPPLVDLHALRDAAREADAGRIATAEARRPFDLGGGSLLRAAILRLGEAEHTVLMTLHHIVADGWSIDLLLREMSVLYAAFVAGSPSPLAPLSIQYADFAAWQREWLQGPALETHLSYWHRRLEGAAPTLGLPTDRPRRAVTGERGGSRQFALTGPLLGALRDLSRERGASLFMTLLAGFQALLARCSGQPEISVGTPIAGRNQLATESIVGLFVNTLVLRANIGDDPGFDELLRRVRTTVLEAHMHQDLPFEKLVEDLQPERVLGSSPLFQVLFAFQTAPTIRSGFTGLNLGSFAVENSTAKFDLSMSLQEGEGRLVGALQYKADLFDALTIDLLLERFTRLLEGIVAAPEGRLSELPLLSSAERRQVLKEWSEGPPTSRQDLCLHELFSAQAARTPEAAAVRYEGEILTFAALDRASNRLGHHLRRLGVGPEVRVGIYLERSLDWVVSLLGVLKAGGCYVPLEPDSPSERLAYQLADSGASVVLTADRSAHDLVDFSGSLVRLDADREAIGRERETAPVSRAVPENLAYVIYTSGSTGRPKGVGVEHRQLAHYLAGIAERLTPPPGASFALVSTFAADLGYTMILPALCGGGCLHVISGERMTDPDLLGEYFERHEIDYLKIVPSHLGALLSGRNGKRVRPRRMLVLGGEASTPSLIERIESTAPGCRILNHYGPTETTVGVSTYPLPAGWRGPSPSVPLGRPLGGSRLYVVDRGGVPVPPGAAGELLVGGGGVSRGYLNRGDLSAERFVPDSLSGEAGTRLYRTGDLVRHLADGSLEFLGRIDDQVKIRGFRVEPREIESLLAAHPEVRESAVVVREDATGECRLAAYVTSRGAESPSVAELVAYLRDRLPAAWVPASVRVLDFLPLTANGKLDRRALPAPEDSDSALGHGGHEEAGAPRTLIEELLSGLWADVLSAGRVGIDDDFFALGGHSLLATRVISRVRESFQVDLPLRALFEAPTVSRLALRIEAARREGRGWDSPPIERVDRDRELPLSFAQQRLWFLDQMEPNSAAYNIPRALHLSGVLEVESLRRSVEELVRRHETLRTTFAMAEGRPRQVIGRAGRVPLPMVDLAGVPNTEAESHRLAETEAASPFDLARGPLLRTRLLRLGTEEHRVLFTLHHIISDAWSREVMIREVAAQYGAFRTGLWSPLPELAVQYADYAIWQRQWLQGEVLAAHLDYWRRRLSGAPSVLELPTDRPRPAIQSFVGASRPLAVPRSLSESLSRLSRARGVTLFMTVLAGLQSLLARYSGQEDVSVGTPVAGRTRIETEGLIGFFVNTLVLRADLSADPSFEDFLAQVRETSLDAHTHQELPFEKLVEELQPERSLSHSPLFQVMLVFESAATQILDLPGLVVRNVPLGQRAAKFDLTLLVLETEQGLATEWDYNPRMFDETTIARMQGSFERLLAEVAKDSGRPISMLSTWSGQERHQVLVDWNDTVSSYPRDLCIHECFALQVALRPEATAVDSATERLSYAELDQRSSRLARRLRLMGVGSETPVGMYVERSPAAVVVMLGILKAGGAYVPLDPSYPVERLLFLLDDAIVPILVTQQHLAEDLPFLGPRLVVVLEQDADGETEVDPLPDRAAMPESLAYVMYTSGSTGSPKGSRITHRGVVRLVQGSSFVALGPEQRFLLHSPLAFDASTFEIWGALLNGGTVAVLPPGLPAVEDLAREVARSGVTTLWLTAGLFHQVAERSLDGFGTVRQLLAGGDVLSPSHVGRSLAGLPGCRVVNGYGPTEGTTFTCCHAISDFDVREASVPLGRPIANTRVYLMDRRFQPVPLGAVGELVIGGDGLARDYLQRPDLTAERFIPDPVSGWPGERLYRTGDSARYFSDGRIQFLGRRDHQVKIRGFRIELGEIEAVLGRYSEIKEVVVVAREDVPGDRRLVAYAVALAGTSPKPEELRRHLLERLPDYMVPSAFVFLERMPLTANGKLDRKALPRPSGERPDLEKRYTAPRTPVEQLLCEIWSQVLRVDRVGVEDNFFSLGGDSILSIQIVSRANEAGLRLTPPDLFQYQTVGALAAVTGLVSAMQEEAPELEGHVPLSPIQQWFFEQELVEPHHFNQSVLLEAREPVCPRRLRAVVRALVEHHDALRLRFERRDGSWHQFQRGFDGEAPLSVVDLSAVPERAQPRAVESVTTWTQTSLNLVVGPLLRVVWIDLGSDRPSRLFLVVHHLVVDGVSWRILLDHLQRGLEQLRDGRELRLPTRTTSFRLWSRRLLDYARSEAMLGQAEYWISALRPQPARLPTEGSVSLNHLSSARSVTGCLDEETTRALLQEVPKAYRTRIQEVLLTALVEAFASWTGSRVLAVDLEGHGREEIGEDLDTSRTVGWFTTVFPVVLDLSRTREPGEALKSIKEQLRSVPQHGLGYGLLRYLSGEEETMGRLASLPPPQVSFNYLGQFDQVLAPTSSFRPASESAGPERSERQKRRHLLEIGGRVSGGRLWMSVRYCEQIHRTGTIEALLASFMEALRALVEHCLSPEAGGVTPSDFPLANLDRKKLDKVLGKLGKARS